jgi:hypothetical protein
MADPSTLSDDSLWCRTERHAWRWDADVPQKGSFIRRRRCATCGATQERVISLRTFTVVQRRPPKYPVGYLLPRGSGRIAMPDVYREQYERMHRVTHINRSSSRGRTA